MAAWVKTSLLYLNNVTPSTSLEYVHTLTHCNTKRQTKSFTLTNTLMYLSNVTTRSLHSSQIFFRYFFQSYFLYLFLRNIKYWDIPHCINLLLLIVSHLQILQNILLNSCIVSWVLDQRSSKMLRKRIKMNTKHHFNFWLLIWIGKKGIFFGNT